MPSVPFTAVFTPLMLCISNVFMTFAWYGHLRYKDQPLWLVIVVAWCIAFVEYCFAVPANRYGSNFYSPVELKTIQEVVSLTVFAVFSVLYLHTSFSWMQGFGFACIALGAFLVFRA